MGMPASDNLNPGRLWAASSASCLACSRIRWILLVTADSSSDSLEFPPVDLLIRCLGDLDDGLELAMEGDSFSSMDNLRGCNGDCVVTGVWLSAGGVGVDTAGVETETKDTGVTNVEGLDRVGA